MNLQRLKELAQRVNYQDFSVNHSGYGVVSSDGTFADCLGMDEATFIYAANPSVVIALIGKLEVAERERDELRAEIARRDAAAGEPVAWKWRLISLDDEPQVGPWRLCLAPLTPGKGAGYKTEATLLYAAAPPAVLPPKLSMDIDPELQGEFRVHEAIRRKGFNQALDAALELGSQPQKPVVLPSVRTLLYEDGCPDIFDANQLKEALDAANVKYEVKK